MSVDTATHRLTLLRHAQAAHARPGQHDFERPLDAVGQAQVHERGALFAATQMQTPVDYCIHSSAVRTTTTALAFTHACGLPKTAVHAEPDLYEIDVPALLAFLRHTPETQRSLGWLGSCRRTPRREDCSPATP
jgi:phosphohistidine phosphatase SixA